MQDYCQGIYLPQEFVLKRCLELVRFLRRMHLGPEFSALSEQWWTESPAYFQNLKAS